MRHVNVARQSERDHDLQRDKTVHDFYRKPRTRIHSPDIQPSSSLQSQKSSSNSSDTSRSLTQESDELYSQAQSPLESPSNLLDILSEIPNRPQVDYSFREADLFYGIQRDEDVTPEQLDPTINEQPQKTAFYSSWAGRVTSLLKPKPTESGFQVVRPGNGALRMARLQQSQAVAGSYQATSSSYSEDTSAIEPRSL